MAPTLLHAKGPETSIKFCLTPTNNGDAPLLVRQGIERQEVIYTYIKDNNCLLNSYVTKDVTTKAAPETESFKKDSSQTAVQFAGALKAKAVGCSDAFSD